MDTHIHVKVCVSRYREKAYGVVCRDGPKGGLARTTATRVLEPLIVV